jgi:hypothetical protein
VVCIDAKAGGTLGGKVVGGGSTDNTLQPTKPSDYASCLTSCAERSKPYQTAEGKANFIRKCGNTCRLDFNYYPNNACQSGCDVEVAKLTGNMKNIRQKSCTTDCNTKFPPPTFSKVFNNCLRACENASNGDVGRFVSCRVGKCENMKISEKLA